MSTTPQSPAFRIKAIKVKSPDPRSVLALLPPEMKKPKIVFKAAAIAALPQVAPVEQEIVAAPQVVIPEVSVEQKVEAVAAVEAVAVEQKVEVIEQAGTPVEQETEQMMAAMEAPKFLPDANSILAILPVEEDEMEVEHFGASKNAEANAPVLEKIADASEFEVIPVQEASFSETQTSAIEMADVESREVEAPEVEAPEVEANEIETPEVEALVAATLETATTEAEIPRLPVIGKPNVFDVASKIGSWIKSHVKIQANKKRLRVCESVSLGEKRFIAVVQLDGKEFLVGGAPNSLSLLANVGKNANATFAEVLNESYEQGRNQG